MVHVSCTVRTMTVSLLLLIGATASGTRATAQSGPGSQIVIVPNPTPRPEDPHAVFRDDPVRKAREQQAATLKRALARLQLQKDTRDILVLAQQIRDHNVNHAEVATGSDILSAQQIEKLAKRVVETSKVQ